MAHATSVALAETLECERERTVAAACDVETQARSSAAPDRSVLPTPLLPPLSAETDRRAWSGRSSSVARASSA